jgi:hypothetical protein
MMRTSVISDAGHTRGLVGFLRGVKALVHTLSRKTDTPSWLSFNALLNILKLRRRRLRQSGGSTFEQIFQMVVVVLI